MRIGVIGANGLVGKRIIKILDGYDVNAIPLGRENVEQYDLGSFDGVMMSVSEDAARSYRGKVKGWLIDNSPAFYDDASVAMVVPEIYRGMRKSVVVSPNCVAIPIALVLDIVRQDHQIMNVWGSSYQSISGAGRAALADYQGHQGLYDTVVPAIGEIEEGVSREEGYIVDCVHKVLDMQFPMKILAVRVPVSIGHGVHIRIECKNKIESGLLEKFRMCPYIQCKAVVTNLEVVNSAKVSIGRIGVIDNVLDMWIMSDNLMRGAAWNMCEIAKQMFGMREKEYVEKAN